MTTSAIPLARVISGGQTGVDRAALDAAIAAGIPHGGWCPRGRLAEDGPIDLRYQLVETANPQYAERTARNVLESEGTLILHRGSLGRGTELTYRFALRFGRPVMVLNLNSHPLPSAVHQWLQSTGVSILNVAGPRESTSPGIYDDAKRFMEIVLAERVVASS